ncbi:MAG: HPP family protein [Paracoccaceae bacterium]
MSQPHPLRRILHGFGPVLPPAHPADLLRAGGGAVAALVLLGLVVWLAGDAAHLRLIAPFGASAVLLFALPNSPLAQPWSALVGNTVSALVALAVMAVLPAGPWGPGIAVGAAIAGMLLVRALHPPGGAVALLVALDPAAHASWSLALAPVAAGTAALIGLALLWHLVTGRVYPFRQPAERPAPSARIGVEADDLAQILDRYRQAANLGVADLARLVGAAEQAAAGHRLDLTCADIMSSDLVTVRPDTPLQEAAAIFRARGFHSLPVTDGGELRGVIFQLNLIRTDGLAHHRAAEVMTTAVPHVSPETPAGAVVALLSDGGVEGVPVMQGRQIVGIVTRSDLISALSRQLARKTTPN